MALLSKIGKAVGSTSGPILGAVAIAGFGAGLMNKAGPATVDAVSDAVLGDPNADKYFMGEQGFSVQGLATAGLLSDPGVALAGSVAGGVAGTAAGAGIGAGLGYVGNEFLKDINIPKMTIPQSVPFIGGKTVSEKIIKSGLQSGKMRGLGIAGAAIGGAIGASAYLRHYSRDNREFLQSNPYNRGSAMQASATGAYGDIVLGMHNTRRG